jgi:hypothetical protein
MKSFLTFLLLSSFLISACQKIFFNDDESIRELPLQDFHAVKISGIYNLVLIQDSTNRLVITGKNRINFIEADIIDDTLIIDDHKKTTFNPARNTLTLHFSNLKCMIFNDPVTLSNRDTIRADKFTLVAIGEIAEVRLLIRCNYLMALNSANTLGNFYFRGKAETCWFWNRYGSNMFADSLQCKDVVVYNESIGDVKVNASDNILAFIRGPGNIYYRGSPVIKISEQKGDGKIIPLD